MTLLAITSAGYTTVDVANIYITEGPEAALEQLAIDGAITIGTAGVGAAAYKTYKVGSVLFKNADDAYKAAAKQLDLPATTSASLASSGVKLNRKLLLDKITDHSFQKHVVEQGEFANLGIATREQFRNHVDQVIENPSSIRYYQDGRQVFLQENTGTVVIKNGINGSSTAFQPRDWVDYIDNYIPKRTTPFP